MADACCGASAGRMQDNEPLMRALSSLIVTNTPDLVLFVGEALVGNDAVDQLSKVAPLLCACVQTVVIRDVRVLYFSAWKQPARFCAASGHTRGLFSG